MNLLIVSSAPFIFKDGKTYAYAPYINEMALWAKYSTAISFCCPVWDNENGLLTKSLPFKIAKHYRLSNFDLTTPTSILKAVFAALYNFAIILKAMRAADHIHLRCPGNIGFLGCIAQVLYPRKTKTAKYAGNWDLEAPQPWSYKLQKKILSSTLTQNMQVLVYGQWPGQSKNIKPFFTATYHESDKTEVVKTPLADGISFVFAGMLVEGKKPLYAIQLVEALSKQGFCVNLSLYGEGIQRQQLEEYIACNNLQQIVFLKGNQPVAVLKEAYKQSHFVVLASQSEGWPKVVAEGMFWGTVPAVTPVSCVAFMLDHGKRGILLTRDLERDVVQLSELIRNQVEFDRISKTAALWSREFTIEKFESEIKKLLL